MDHQRDCTRFSFCLVCQLPYRLWPQLFNLSSIPFLQKSAQLSQQKDIQQYKEAVVTIQDQYTKGTGFNISSDGLIVTNHHVIDEMNPITVSFPNGELFRASILVSNQNVDLAVLKIDGNNLPFLTLSKAHSWQNEDAIYVIGNPLLHNQIVNEGNILAGSDENGVLLISAPVYKGNSGSPIISLDGEVIGVVYAKSTKEPIGYGVPVEKVLKQMNEAEIHH